MIRGGFAVTYGTNSNVDIEGAETLETRNTQIAYLYAPVPSSFQNGLADIIWYNMRDNRCLSLTSHFGKRSFLQAPSLNANWRAPFLPVKSRASQL